MRNRPAPVRILTIAVELDVEGGVTWRAEGLDLDLAAAMTGSYGARVVYDAIASLGNAADAWSGAPESAVER